MKNFKECNGKEVSLFAMDKKTPNTFVEYGIDRENHKNRRLFGISTEINNPDGSESRVYGKVPIKVCEVYIRIWIGKFVICFGSGSFSMRIKDKARFKLVFGFSGTQKDKPAAIQALPVQMPDVENKRREMLRVAICGLDGIGKTTLIEKLKEKFLKAGVTIAQTKVPFTCKKLMEDTSYEGLSEFEIVRRVGMAFDFSEHYHNLDVSADLLLCDRYDIDFEVLNDVYDMPQNYKDIMHAIYMKAPRLDLCFYLRADYSLAAERLIKRGDRKENENDEILRGMQIFFDERCKDYPKMVVLDATKSADEIGDEAYAKILSLLDKG